ncbi:MAG: phosphoglucosamine mutase, partial [Burkholderiaceae bacterium]
FSARGTKLSDSVEERIEAELEQPWHCVDSSLLGKVRRLDDAAGRYIEFCKRTFPNEADLKGLKIVVDSAHGAAYHIASPVFHELGAEVVSLGAAPNGMNINDGVGAVHPYHLADAVRSNQADFGIALDGDADRVVIADAEGRIYNGDELLYIIVRDRMRYAKVNGVAGTLMTNYSLERRLRELGIPFARARVGDRYVLETLQEKNWLYGGEGSGHLLFLDCHTTGDGIVSALQVLSAARRQSKSLAQMTEDLVLMPQALVNAVVQRGFEWRSHSALVAAVSDAERELNGSGRVLIRPSGTEPVLRVMVEASEAKIAEAMAQRLASIVLRPALN